MRKEVYFSHKSEEEITLLVRGEDETCSDMLRTLEKTTQPSGRARVAASRKKFLHSSSKTALGEGLQMILLHLPQEK